MQPITRRVDRLGRIVLPADARKAMHLYTNSQVLISLEDGTLTIRNCTAACKLCAATGHIDGELGICRSCIEKIKHRA